MNGQDGAVATNVFTVRPTVTRHKGRKSWTCLSNCNNWKMIVIA